MSSESGIEERLRDVLAFLDGHVKFAEAKNTALLTANVAAVLASLTVLTSNDPHSDYLVWYLRELVACCVASGSLSLLSFLPRTEIPWLRRKGKPDAADDDLLFFGHVKAYQPDAYLKAVSAALGDSSASRNRWHELYARQIIINARIAQQKFTYFRYAIWLTLAGCVTIPLATVVYFVFHDRDDF